jgi:predicted DNA-binding protein (MmcQ/YjbR family)
MASHIDWLRMVCLALPHATEDIQWEHNLLFRIAGKMFCITNLDPAVSRTKMSFKCTPEKFAELVEIEGIIPAPYMARNHWVAIVEMNALRQAELRELIEQSYQMVRGKLPKKTQAALSGMPRARRGGKVTKAKQPKPRRAVKRRK